MINIARTEPNFVSPKLKVIGIGGAGGNALDRIVLDGLTDAELIAVNTDLQALAGSVAPMRIQIGQTITRGLGTGGDPEIGRTAAEECSGELQRALSDATIVFVLAGLGGGTGSGALPVIADVAHEQNAFVVVIGTLPFTFEGKRRAAQAAEAFDAVRGLADLVICFANDKMGDVVAPDASVQEAFAAADQTLSQCVRVMAAMVHQRGLLRVGFDEIGAALRGQARAYFGFGEADGDNRTHDALATALKNPLLDQGRALRQADSAVVQVVGGDDFTLNELTIVMEEVQKLTAEETRLHFGTAIDPQMTGRLSIAIFCASPAESVAPAALSRSRETREIPAASEPAEEAPGLSLETPEIPAVEEDNEASDEDEEEETIVAEEAGAADVQAAEEEEIQEPQPVAVPRRTLFAPMQSGRRSDPAPARPAPVPLRSAPIRTREERQEQMQFEPVNRGRFEKSEPTIIDGQDLDVPTFMRRNVRK